MADGGNMRIKKGNLTPRELRKLGEDAKKWASKDGRSALKKALSRAHATTSLLSEERTVEPQSLRMPLNL